MGMDQNNLAAIEANPVERSETLDPKSHLFNEDDLQSNK